MMWCVHDQSSHWVIKQTLSNQVMKLKNIFLFVASIIKLETLYQGKAKKKLSAFLTNF